MMKKPKQIFLATGVENRGVDDETDEIGMRNLDPFRFKFFADAVQKAQLIAPHIQELTEKHLLLKE